MRGLMADNNLLGFTAAEAAYAEGDDWLQAQLAYLRGNRDRLISQLADLPGIKIAKIEATYLAWIDARGLGQENPARFFEQNGVGLSDGTDFGLPGWVRLNFGCPAATLDSALERIVSACATRKA